MNFFEKEFDITRNIRMIEWLKSELLCEISSLFTLLQNGFKEEIQDRVSEILAHLIILAFVLGKRLGLTYAVIHMKIESKLKIGIVENTDIEKHYGDLSSLSQHFKRKIAQGP